MIIGMNLPSEFSNVLERLRNVEICIHLADRAESAERYVKNLVFQANANKYFQKDETYFKLFLANLGQNLY